MPPCNGTLQGEGFEKSSNMPVGPKSNSVLGNQIQCPLWVKSAAIAHVCFNPDMLLTGVKKLHPERHCIPGTPYGWRLSDTQEHCPDPRRRLGKDALRLYHTCAQPYSPLRGISLEVSLGSFGDIRTCCLLAPAHRCTVFSVLGRSLAQPQFWFSLEHHCSGQQRAA